MTVSRVFQASDARCAQDTFRCCKWILPKVALAVATFFTVIAKAIYSGLSWIWNRIVCCRPSTKSYITNFNFAPLERSIRGLNAANVTAISIEDKRARALARLKEIKSRLESKNPIYFAVQPALQTFDLDVALEPYSTTIPTDKIVVFFDFANPGELEPFDARRTNLMNILYRYTTDYQGEHTESVKKTTSQILSIWHCRREKAELAGEDTEALKEEINDKIADFVDAHGNCVDQVNSQLENILLDVLSSELNAIGNQSRTQTRAQTLASHALFKYRANLVNEFCIQFYPDEIHMADLERAVKQSLATKLNIQSCAIEKGACYSYIINDLPYKTKKIEAEFAQIYHTYGSIETDRNPVAFLFRELKVCHGLESIRKIRAEISKMVMAEYDIAGGYNEEFEIENPIVKELVEIASDEGVDGFLMGQNWSQAGCYWFMEQTGLIKEIIT